MVGSQKPPDLMWASRWLFALAQLNIEQLKIVQASKIEL
jgi:hypothetical protein